MSDPIVYEFPETDKLTRQQQRTLILVMEALLFGVPRRQIARYIADREGVGLRAVQRLLKRSGINIRKIPFPKASHSNEVQWKLDAAGMQRCRTCGEVKPAAREYFAPIKKDKSRLGAQCSDCSSTRARHKSHERRAMILNAQGTHTADDIKALYKSQKGKCWYCGKKVGDKYDVDHRVPLSRGGSNAPDNLVIACPTCNRSKHDRLPHEWCGRLL